MQLFRSSYTRVFAVSLGLIVAACSGGSNNGNDLFGSSSPSTGTSSGNPPPIEGSSGGGTTSGGQGSSGGATSGGTTSGSSGIPPKPKLEVTAQIVSATLADDCGAQKPSNGDLAPCPDPKNCPTYCQQSNVQINFKTGDGSATKVKIVSVTLHEASSDKLLDTLTARTPRWWTNNTYAPWDETLSPNNDLKVTYDLSAPQWAKMGNTSYSTQYQLQVTIEIDGTTQVLESVTISRDPPVVT